MRKILTILLIFLGGLFGICRAAEWSHYTERKEMTIFVSQTKSVNPKCKDQKESSEQKFVLGKWHYIRELCYSLNAKGDLVFSDPNSINPFSNFVLKSDNFTYIPTQSEKEAAKAAKEAIANRERTLRMIEAINRNATESQRQIQNMHHQDGITHMIINGEPVLCRRIGSIMHCD